MGNVLRFAAVMFALLLFAATARSDVATSTDDAGPSTAEPVTGVPVEPAPGFETAAKDPFAPYGIGPIEEAIPYEALSVEEQAVADRGLDDATWSGVHRGFGAAVAERSKRARAEAAQHQLGIDALETTGVVP